MRVLFLTHSYPRVLGDAAGNFLLHLAVALRGEGIEVRVVAPSGNDLAAHEEFLGVRVDRFRYAPRRFENLAYTGEMARIVQRSWSAKLALLGFLGAEFAAAARVRREFQPDLVHAHWWFPGGLVGTWAAGLADLPLITTMHGTDVRLAKSNTFARPLFRRVMQHSRAVTTVSRWLASEVQALAPSVAPTVAPMPVSTDLFSPGNGAPQSVPPRMLFIGRLNEQKGIAQLLDAVAAMRHSVALDVVGDGSDGDALRARSESLGLGARVTWHGALAQHQLVPLYRRAALLAIPSIDEGLGLVSVEAQLCGTPVVAFASGGIVDTVIDGETGLLVPPGDVRAFSRALDRLFDDPALRARLGLAGRMSALASFAPESAARRYAGIYRTAIAA